MRVLKNSLEIDVMSETYSTMLITFQEKDMPWDVTFNLKKKNLFSTPNRSRRWLIWPFVFTTLNIQE